jgi:hypothetical protein
LQRPVRGDGWYLEISLQPNVRHASPLLLDAPFAFSRLRKNPRTPPAPCFWPLSSLLIGHNAVALLPLRA